MKIIVLVLFSFFLVCSTSVGAENVSNPSPSPEKQTLNDIVNENLQESTDLFLQNTQNDIESYVAEAVEDTKKSVVLQVKEFIRPDNLSNLFSHLFSSLLDNVKSYLNTSSEDVQK